MHALILIAVYLAVTLTPLVLSALQGRAMRPFWDEISSGLAMTAFAIVMRRFTPLIVFFFTFAGAGVAAQDQSQVIECLDPLQVTAANDAYEAYCAPCHKPEKLARKWFSSRGTGEDAVNSLQAFLDNHGSCPHNHHELLARWLLEKADSN